MDIQQIFAARQQAEQNRRLECYRRLNRVAKKGQIVFAGSSLMEQFPIDELQHSLDLPWCIYNRGIGGYVSSQMLQGLEAMVLELEPAKLFINIGTNDIGLDIQDQLWPNYKEILRRVKDRLPGCRVDNLLSCIGDVQNIAHFNRIVIRRIGKGQRQDA